MNIIDIARECGAIEAVDAEDGAELIQFTPAQLIALRDRIRADEREKAAKAGWQAAMTCHSQFGMAGWSSHRDEFLGAAIRNSSSAPTA